MKSILAFALGLVLVSGSAFSAEQGGEPNQGPRGGDRLARMQQHLGLSDEQVEQIREIRANGGGREEIRGVLTEEQLATMQERRARMQGRRGKDGGRGKAPAGQPAEPNSSDGND